MKGLDVWELQIKLIAWGSGPDPDGIGVPNQPVIVNGTFDRATADAVKRFQNALALILPPLPVTGVVDDATFRAIDREAALYPVLVHDFRCNCAKGKNTITPVPCRCYGTAAHPNEGVCTGFGKGGFMNTFALDGITLPDGTNLGVATEQLDVYDKGEHDGMDKALLWAVRGLMRRATVDRIGVLAGYQCWHDNYHHTDLRRLRHRTSTFHMGKTVEFYHAGTCAQYGQDVTAATCATCAAIRTVAIQKCGFQQRWQQAGRVSVGETGTDGPPPFSKYAVMVSTVRRTDKHLTDFVKTYHASLEPLYDFKAPTFAYPVNLGADATGYSLNAFPSETYFKNTENGAHGWFPVGASRMWHGGVHIFAGAGAEVHAMADGEIVGVRAGEAEAFKTFGSRNFVLIKHKHGTKEWFSLYMHLDAGVIDAVSPVPWRKDLHARTVDHILLSAPAPVMLQAMVVEPPAVLAVSRLSPRPGFPAGSRLATAGGAAAADPRTALDTDAPLNSQVIALAAPPNTYAFTQMENVVLATVVAADAALTNLIATNDLIAVNPPIKVSANELIGYIGAAPTDPGLAGGSFLHWEAFSAANLLPGAGYTVVDVASAAVSLDRKDLTLKMKTATFAKDPPDNVILPADRAQDAVNLLAMRSCVLKMTNEWALSWKTAMQAAPPFSFMPDVGRDTLGDLMDEYRWWTTIAPLGNSSVFHYHPLTLMLQLAALP